MIALDTNVIIYFLERHPEFYTNSEMIIRKLFETGGVISVLMFTEVTAGGKDRSSVLKLLEFVDKLVQENRLVIIDINQEIAISAGKIRNAHKNISTQDALHIACAKYAGAKVFYTNDRQLVKASSVDGIVIKPLG